MLESNNLTMIGSPTILKEEFERHDALIREWASMNKKKLDKLSILQPFDLFQNSRSDLMP